MNLRRLQLDLDGPRYKVLRYQGRSYNIIPNSDYNDSCDDCAFWNGPDEEGCPDMDPSCNWECANTPDYKFAILKERL
jgi:hypothetical protein